MVAHDIKQDPYHGSRSNQAVNGRVRRVHEVSRRPIPKKLTPSTQDPKEHLGNCLLLLPRLRINHSPRAAPPSHRRGCPVCHGEPPVSLKEKRIAPGSGPLGIRAISFASFAAVGAFPRFKATR
ncbi:hypothetical protein CSAL01_09614 [Colletotrichum salicis]|uniref:Uncharacterized protein n=1 Tax=Colletotrichum salicis TaxID=1209931 RepID=A0A135ULC7_9PEZI|nr:hypothetical protein CSAL01_09614 [Colletotrichum salicis]